MMELLSFCTFPWWLAWLLPFLLGLLVGWGLWSRWRQKYDNIYTDLQNDRARINALEVDNDKLRDAINDHEDVVSQLKIELKDAENIVEAYKIKLNNTISESKFKSLQEDRDSWKKKFEDLEQDLVNSTGIISSLEKEYVNLQSQVSQEQDSVWEQRFHEANQILEAANNDIERLQSEQAALGQQLADTAKERDSWLENYEGAVETINTLEHKMLNYEKMDSKQELNSEESLDEASRERLAKIEEENARWKQKYSKLENNIQELLKINATWENEYDKLKNRYEQEKAQDWEGRYREKHALLARIKGEVENLKLRYAEVDNIISAKEKEAAEWRSRYLAITTSDAQSTITSSLADVDEGKPTGDDQEQRFSALDKENLQFVEGIGPAMESVLKDNGIRNLNDLGSSTVEDIQKILDSYGDKYRIIDPITWVHQAKLAADDKWQELIELQKNLDAGSGDRVTRSDSKVEKIMVKLGLVTEYKEDDLTAIEGIGPATKKLLMNNGITTWQELADTTTDNLQRILDEAGSNFQLVDPTTWVNQAKLAAEGRFDELREYQDLLNGGNT